MKVDSGLHRGKRAEFQGIHRHTLLRAEETPYPLVYDVLVEGRPYVMHLEDLKDEKTK